jgi:fatty acid desaturase
VHGPVHGPRRRLSLGAKVQNPALLTAQLSFTSFHSFFSSTELYRISKMREAHSAAETTEVVEHSSPAFTPPKYTMKEIYDAIPPHCFQSHTFLSLIYVLRDFAFVFSLAAMATQIPNLPHPYLQNGAWMAYSFLQGLVFTGLWEIAHECGHGALSKHKWVNGALGMLIHSLLLVPFYSWRLTHAQHHKATNNLERDIAFVPDLKKDYLAARNSRKPHFKFLEMVEDTPIVALITLFFHQLIAWPIYLTLNNFALPRMKKAPWWKRSHFYTGGDGPNFKPQNGMEILISDLGIAAMATVLWVSINHFGAWNVALYYVFPYLWTNHWIRELYSKKERVIVLTNHSYHNISSAYRHGHSLLSLKNLDISQGSSVNGRPGFRIHWAVCLSWSD